jgi:hypothetical protein
MLRKVESIFFINGKSDKQFFRKNSLIIDELNYCSLRLIWFQMAIK